LKKYKSPGSNQILAELIRAGGETLLPVIHEITNSIWTVGELPEQWMESIVKVIGEHQSGFRQNRSTTHQIFCIHQILKKKWEDNKTVHQLIIDLKKAYVSVRREVLYNILIEFGIPMNLARLIKMCLNEMYSKARIGKH
jgi:hypothetical protein